MNVNRADDVWVDAGDSVRCIFSTPFAAAGEKHCAVRVGNARPGDRAANDSAGGSIQVYATSDEFTSRA